MLNQRIDRTPDGNLVVKVGGVNYYFSGLEEIVLRFQLLWHLKVPPRCINVNCC